jgi:lipoic acid synthetase
VTRDDLPNGGAIHFAKTVDAIRQINPNTTVEVLVPDFQGSVEALQTVTNSVPEVINHNIETVPRLYSEVRPQADYHRSLNLLRTVKLLNHSIITKSGLMLGLGEKDYEVVTVMKELRAAECDCVTLGQYLPPSPKHYHLARYLTPPEFEEYHNMAREMGFSSVRSGPFTRSSSDALEICREVH